MYVYLLAHICFVYLSAISKIAFISMPAWQITHTGWLYITKKVNQLLALVDNQHLKSKDNLYQKALEFTNERENLDQ